MRRLLLFITFLILASLSCQAVMDGIKPPALGATASPELRTIEAPSYDPVQEPDLPGEEPTESVKPAPQESAEPVGQDQGFEVRFHPDGPLYVGDRVSIEVIPAQDFNPSEVNDAQVEVRLVGNDQVLGKESFVPFGIGNRTQATFKWVWDTSSLPPGEHTLSFSRDPGDVEWKESLVLLPHDQVPFPEPEARWMQVESECCVYHFISGTEAERDLEELIDLAEEMAGRAWEIMGLDAMISVNPIRDGGSIDLSGSDDSEKLKLTFLPRVLGHGGFAGEEISISYLDRNYSGGGMDLVLHHEMVHILDGRLGGELRPSLFVEGLAVYLSGGHFKAEPLVERAAALLHPEPGCVDASENLTEEAAPPAGVSVCRLGTYLPLQPLLDDFYFSQHELGYLQAGALVEYMVETWGWEVFETFYRDIHPLKDQEGNASIDKPSDAVEQALLEHFDMTLVELEGHFIAALEEVPVTPAWVEDVRLTVAFYDTVRRYQELLDPSAYFLYAWLPGNAEMREEQIVEDYLRRPISEENIIIESLLVQADEELRQSDYPAVQRLLDSVNRRLDRVAG